MAAIRQNVPNEGATKTINGVKHVYKHGKWRKQNPEIAKQEEATKKAKDKKASKKALDAVRDLAKDKGEPIVDRRKNRAYP
tara:strand:+ start:201 stop:443 length:243 start_codon:yes stop_codon:yes gene_type:complete